MASLPRSSFVFSLLLGEILKKAETRSLRECRKVNKFWRHVADPILLQRKDNIICFSDFATQETFVSGKLTKAQLASQKASSDVQNQQQNEDKNLNFFLFSYAEPSNSPPTRNFQFIGPNFGAESFTRFISIYFPHIKELVLDWGGQEFMAHELPPNVFSPREMLWFTVIANGRLEQLETLRIKNFDVFGQIGAFNNLKLQYPAQPLPSLRFLEIEMDHSFSFVFRDVDQILPDLIAMAPNLEQINYTKYFMGENGRQIFLERPTLFRLESLNFCIFDERRRQLGEKESPFQILDYTEKICSQNKGLLYLTLYSFNPPPDPTIFHSTISTLMKLLTRSQNSFESLSFGGPTLILFMKMSKACEIETFCRVKKVHLGYRSNPEPEEVWNKFPKTFQLLFGEDWDSPMPNFAALFPRLENLDVDIDESFEKFFPLQNDHLNEVKSLHIGSAMDTPATCKILQIVPFVTTVEIGNMCDLPSLAGLLWQLEHVETLRLGIHLQDELRTPAHFPPNIDCAFTGLTEDTLLLVKCLGEEILQGPALNELRTNPSILNLRKLSSLTLDFYHGGRDEDFEKNFAGFFTDISFKFGFALMENLKVSLKSTDAIVERQLSLLSSFENVSVELQPVIRFFG